MSVRIDCDSCLVRGLACHDCVVTVLLGPPPELSFDAEEQQGVKIVDRGTAQHARDEIALGALGIGHTDELDARNSGQNQGMVGTNCAHAHDADA